MSFVKSSIEKKEVSIEISYSKERNVQVLSCLKTPLFSK